MIKDFLAMVFRPIYWPIKDRLTNWQYRNYDRHKATIKDNLKETQMTLFVEQEDGSLLPLDLSADRDGRMGSEVRIKNQEARRAFLNAKD